MIKSIVFDWGGVLIDRPTPGLLLYFAEYFNVSEEQFNNAHKKYVDSFQKGLLTEEIYWEKICNDLLVKKPIENSLWKTALKSVYHEQQDVLNIASTLKKTGYKTGLLSNCEVPAMEYFYEKGYNMFDVVVFSCKERFRKPDKKIYEITLSRLNTKPGETIFIDDRLENIHGAKNLGIHAILFKNIKELKENLNDFSINLS